jgi:hypothetical protein
MNEAQSRRWQLGIGSAVLTGWFVWAFLRTMPPRPIARGLASPSNNGSAYHLWAYAHMAYSDVVSLYNGHQLFTHALPYISVPIEYPVLMGIFMWLAAWVPGLFGYLLVTTAVMWAASLATFRWLVQWRPHAAWGFALSPLFLAYGIMNWDVLGIFLMAWGLYAYERKRYDLSAVVFAGAVFFKLFPVFYLPYIAITLWTTGQRARLKRMVGLFALTSVILNVPFAVANWKNWSLFFSFNATRAVGADIWENHWIHLTSTVAVDALSLLAVVVTAAITARLVARGGSLYHAAALLFAVFLFVNKVYSPQYTLWLLAFAALANWPVWTLALFSFSGLTDDVNSFTILRLMATHARNAAAYGIYIYPWGLVVRYLAIVAAVVGVQWSRTRRQDPHVEQGAMGPLPPTAV